MPKPPQREKLIIDGPAGRLESLLEMPADQAPSGSAVICHPHPQQGGSLQNKVVHTLARAFQHLGMRSLRFNFRGVGDSDGSFGNGRGEQEDAAAVLDQTLSWWPQEPIWLAGFSFGAAVAIHAAVAKPVAGLVSVAPAVSRFTGSLATQPQCPWLIVHGDRDEVVAIDETVNWVNELQPGPELRVFPDTGHFFHGKLVELRETVVRFVAANKGA